MHPHTLDDLIADLLASLKRIGDRFARFPACADPIKPSCPGMRPQGCRSL
jgi:hypothetical protein